MGATGNRVTGVDSVRGFESPPLRTSALATRDASTVVQNRIAWGPASFGLVPDPRTALTLWSTEPLRYSKGMARISSKNQVTLPVESLKRAGLSVGDEVAIEADGADRIVVRRVSRDAERVLGVFDGLYEPGYLERLRSGERA
jgi:bifunctional DNA-binding transcriptional regulator/antitoxin component of YhaV-PrlF toxin-antitoxin module